MNKHRHGYPSMDSAHSNWIYYVHCIVYEKRPLKEREKEPGCQFSAGKQFLLVFYF